MSRRHSFSDANNIYISCAILAAHFNFQRRGFRQRDLRFYIELFSNWMESTIGEHTLSLHNAQIQRWMEELVKRGWAHKVKDEAKNSYELTRTGLVSIVSGFSQRKLFLPLDQIFFLYYFLKSYGPLFDSLLMESEAHFSPSLRRELDILRHPERLLRVQAEYLETKAENLEGRIEEALGSAAITRRTVEDGRPIEEAVAEIQRRYPYELSPKKPLKELMKELPQEIHQRELTSGFKNRVEFLWKPLQEYLEMTAEILKNTLKGEGDGKSG